MANQFLIKDTMQEMRDLSADEIDGLKGNNPIYAGVQLLGYHQKGDTPAPIIYYYVNPLTKPDLGPDDGGSIILVSSTKFEHKFNGEVNALYFVADNSATVDSAPFIQKALDSLQNKGGIVYLPE